MLVKRTLLSGDRFCWVYNLPVHLYGELSLFKLHSIYVVCYLPLILSCTHMLPSPFLHICSRLTIVTDYSIYRLLEVLGT